MAYSYNRQNRLNLRIRWGQDLEILRTSTRHHKAEFVHLNYMIK
jgi:hypothetical protein